MKDHLVRPPSLGPVQNVWKETGGCVLAPWLSREWLQRQTQSDFFCFFMSTSQANSTWRFLFESYRNFFSKSVLVVVQYDANDDDNDDDVIPEPPFIFSHLPTPAKGHKDFILDCVWLSSSISPVSPRADVSGILWRPAESTIKQLEED